MARALALLAGILASAAGQPAPYTIPGTGVAFRNGPCTTECPLLIMLHGSFESGDGFYQRNTHLPGGGMHTSFQGIVAYPDGVFMSSGRGWPQTPNWGRHWVSGMNIINDLVAMPDVDRSRVFAMGFSNGGFFAYALACEMGSRLRGIVIVSSLFEMQPSPCTQRTNVFHIHDLNDNINAPQDRPAMPNALPPADRVLGLPTTLRQFFLNATAYGPAGAVSNASSHNFTHYSATLGNLSYIYWMYDGAAQPTEHRHRYHVWNATEPGSPGNQQDVIQSFLTLSDSVPTTSSTQTWFAKLRGNLKHAVAFRTTGHTLLPDH